MIAGWVVGRIMLALAFDKQHTTLLNGPDTATRVHRARVIRLAKAAIKQDETPVVTSFNIKALALDHVDADSTISEGLRDLLFDGADALYEGLTLDPAKSPTRSSSRTVSRAARPSAACGNSGMRSREPLRPTALRTLRTHWRRCTRTSSSPVGAHAAWVTRSGGES